MVGATPLEILHTSSSALSVKVVISFSSIFCDFIFIRDHCCPHYYAALLLFWCALLAIAASLKKTVLVIYFAIVMTSTRSFFASS
ncbi:MAG: hypothetical protein ACJAQX_000765 [Polaribacter sp.]|jgi:hypothetical protein